MEFLVYMEVVQQQPGDEAQKLQEQEAERAKELAAAGFMRRLWRVPGRRANWGIWNADTTDELHEALTSLPLFAYMSVTVHPLANHPNDPKLSLT